MNFQEREFEDDIQGSSMQYNDKTESTKLAKELDRDITAMTRDANE